MGIYHCHQFIKKNGNYRRGNEGFTEWEGRKGKIFDTGFLLDVRLRNQKNNKGKRK